MTAGYIAILLCLGSFSGFLAGITGGGGNMVITPFLCMMLVDVGVPPEYIVHSAIATSMATIMFTSASSIQAHNKKGAVLWRVAASIAPGILVGGMLGAKFSSLLPTFWISVVFVVFVFVTAWRMVAGGNSASCATRSLPEIPGLFGAGSFIGVVSSLVGAGGGFISVPFMVRCNVPIHNAVGTSAALGFPIAASGAIGYALSGLDIRELDQIPWMLGYIHLPSLLTIAAASTLTAKLGARVAHRINVAQLKKIFACLLVALGLNMLYKTLQML